MPRRPEQTCPGWTMFVTRSGSEGYCCKRVRALNLYCLPVKYPAWRFLTQQGQAHYSDSEQSTSSYIRRLRSELPMQQKEVLGAVWRDRVT